MKIYELTYLISLEATGEELRSLQERISSFIAEKQGIINRTEEVVKKKLGYPVKKQTMAYLAGLNFHLEQGKIKDLEEKIKAENQILRYEIISKKPVKITKTPRRFRLRAIMPAEGIKTVPEKPKKVEIKEIEKKLEEILGE